MKVGKNLHSDNKKKAYRKPVLEVVEVDRVILLQTGNSELTEPGGGGTDGPAGASAFPSENKTNTQPPSKSSNPFGGGTPEYER